MKKTPSELFTDVANGLASQGFSNNPEEKGINAFNMCNQIKNTGIGEKPDYLPKTIALQFLVSFW